MDKPQTTCPCCHGEGSIMTIGGSRNTCEQCLGKGHTGSPFDKREPITQTTKLDWTKPIQFENGEPLELVRVHPWGCPSFRATTHSVFRPTETQPMAAMWHVNADGQSRLPGFSIVNRPAAV